MRGIKSAFEFESYKIDSLHLEMKRVLGVLEFRGNIDQKTLLLDISFREPLYIKRQKKYVGGLVIKLTVAPPVKNGQGDQPKEENIILRIDLSISGLFRTEQGQFDPKTEQNLVTQQIPAILFPYVRATLSSLLANAGFGSVVLPLINIHEVAKKAKLEIKEVDW